MEYLKYLSFIVILKILHFHLISAYEEKFINSNLSRGILGCKRDCYRCGSCSKISYDIKQFVCWFSMSQAKTRVKKGVTEKLLSEFPCVNNTCGRHKKCLITRKGHQACIDMRRKSSATLAVTTAITKGQSERTVVLTTQKKECVYDFITRKQHCIRYPGYNAETVNAKTGNIFYGTSYPKKMYRKKLLSKKKEYEGEGYSFHFHIFNNEKIAYIDDTSTVSMTTTKFEKQPFKFRMGVAPFFWTAVDQEKELLLYATEGLTHIRFKTLDLKTYKPGSTFKIRGDHFNQFVTHGGNVFFCRRTSVKMASVITKRSKIISGNCEQISLFDGNIFIVPSKSRSIKKFNSKGKFMKQVKMPPRSRGDLRFIHFTSFSLKDLKKMANRS